MKTASRPPIHAAAAPSDAGVPNRASERAASAVTVTGLISANACSQSGKVETGTNTELAKTSGKITTNPAVCAVSAPRTVSATKAKIQLRARPKAATTAMHPTAPATPPRKRNPTRYPTAIISPMMTMLRTRSARVRPASTAERSEEHTSELQSQSNLVCRLLLEKKKKNETRHHFLAIMCQDLSTTIIALHSHDKANAHAIQTDDAAPASPSFRAARVQS